MPALATILQKRRVALTTAVAVALIVPAGLTLGAPKAFASDAWTGGVIINEVYGGGGNSGAAFNQDFVELYNPTDAAIDLTGWSLQYTSSARTFSANNTQPLSGTIAAGGYFLVGEAPGTGTTLPPLPTPDLVGSLNLSGTGGKIALVTNTTPLTCNSAPACATVTSIADLVGWGSNLSAYAGTAGAPATTNATSVSRDANHDNTGDNAADFTAGTPTPQNSGPGGSTEPPTPPEPTTVTIEQIQGTGPSSPLVGQTVTTTGVVTATYPTGGLNGYVIQTGGTGGPIDFATHTASDAVFVFSAATVGQVAIGDNVQVTGTVSEYQGLTELTVSSTADLTKLADTATVTPATTDGWPATDAQRETLESMLYAPGQFTVTNVYSTNQYGTVGLAAGDKPLIQPTDVAAPGSADAAAVAADNAARAVTLDDGSTMNFMSSPNNNNATPPYVSLTNPVRVGAAVTFEQPVIVDYRYSLWTFNPTHQLTADEQNTDPVATFENTRTTAPANVGGDLKIGSFNVENYFTTTGDEWGGCSSYKDRAGNPITVNTCPGLGPRGAWDQANLDRQTAKIVSAINALGADVVGLMEIENSLALGYPKDEALATLTAALNQAAGAGTWAYISVPSSALPPTSEMDAITVAMIYKPASVTPIGDAVMLADQSADDQAFGNAREPIGQEFKPVGGGEPFFVVVNHLKSKGSAGPWPGDADQGDGQGASTQSRIRQAQALVNWLPTVTSPGEAVIMVGDYNSYTQEDPLQILYADGFVDAHTELGNPSESSYSYDGLSGSLDHILLNQAALARATGMDIWQINAQESVALDYSRYNYTPTNFYQADPYASSDHDPEIVGITRGDMSASAADSTATLRPSTTTPTSGAARLANGADTYTITVHVEDAWNDPLTGQANLLKATASDPAVTVSAVTDNGDGTYTYTATSATPGSYTITVTLDGTQLSQPLPVNFIAAQVGSSSVVQGTDQTATGSGFVPGENVTVSVDGVALTATPSAVGANGSVSASFATDNLAPGPHTVTFTGSASGTVTAGFQVTQPGVPSVPSAAQSTVALAPSTTTPTAGAARLADGADAFTVTVTVNDASGKPMAGQAGALAAEPSDPAVTISEVTDNGDGTYTYTATATIPGSYTILVTLGGDQVGQPVAVNFITADISTDPVEQGDTQVAAGLGFLQGEKVSVFIDNTAMEPAQLTPDEDGTVTVSFPTADLALGSHTVTFVGSTSGKATIDFTVVAANPNTAPANPDEQGAVPLVPTGPSGSGSGGSGGSGAGTGTGTGAGVSTGGIVGGGPATGLLMLMVVLAVAGSGLLLRRTVLGGAIR